MKKLWIPAAILLLLFLLFRFNAIASIQYFDDIKNSDEFLIKAFRSHHHYTIGELRQLKIEYLGEVDGYRIYDVSYKGSVNSDPWTKQGYTFPPESHTRVIGIKKGSLYVLGELVHESNIDIKRLYEVIQSKF